MRHLIILILLTGLCAIGYSQHKSETSKNTSQDQNGPQMAQVKLEADYHQDMQKIIKDKPVKSAGFKTRKFDVHRLSDVTRSQVKYQTTAEIKPRRILKYDPSDKFGQGKLQYKSKDRSKNQLKRVEGYVPREEVIKIEGHPVYDPSLLNDILGHGKMLKANTSKEE
jgi:hypothetical protein